MKLTNNWSNNSLIELINNPVKAQNAYFGKSFKINQDYEFKAGYKESKKI